MQNNILVIHGPNLNIPRETDIYGHFRLEEINRQLHLLAKELRYSIQSFFSNHEGQLIEYIQEHAPHSQGLIINPAGYTHTSVALRDTVLAVSIPCVEVHLSNIYKREAFRQVSYFHDIAVGVIVGFGGVVYELALRGLVDFLSRSHEG